MRVPFLSLLCALLIAACKPRTTPADEDYVVGPAGCAARERWIVMSAVRHDGELWVVDSGARLWSMSPETGVVTRRLPSDDVFGVAVVKGTLVVLAVHEGASTLVKRDGKKWGSAIALGRLADKDAPALMTTPDALVVLTRHRAWTFSAGSLTKTRELAIEPALPAYGAWPLPQISGRTIYLVEPAEERSSIAVFDVDSGKWRNVDAHGDAMCSGAFDSRCDVVIGLVADPSRQGCAIASVRAPRHAGYSLLRICGDVVTPVVTAEPVPVLAQLVNVNGDVCGTDGVEQICVHTNGSVDRVPFTPSREICHLPVRTSASGSFAVGKPPRVLE